jgi:hypothetical protein
MSEEPNVPDEVVFHDGDEVIAVWDGNVTLSGETHPDLQAAIDAFWEREARREIGAEDGETDAEGEDG